LNKHIEDAGYAKYITCFYYHLIY